MDASGAAPRRDLEGGAASAGQAKPCAPLLKWVGGKQRLLPELVKRLPVTFKRYFEPFAGGAALFFHLAWPDAILGDLNAELMHTYAAVAAQPELVLASLSRKARLHAALSSADRGLFYYRLRSNWNYDRGRMTDAGRAASFIYLNRTCYNGLWRTNKQGEFNAPAGRYKNPTICDPQRILACSQVLAQSTIWTGDYQTTTCDARAGDLVYFDPPYVPVSPTANFTGYTPGGFRELDHVQLANYARALVERGVYVMLSNADTPLVRRLYRGFKIGRVKAARAINSKGARRGKVNEVIITGGYDQPRRRSAA